MQGAKLGLKYGSSSGGDGITQLTGDVSATGPGSASATVNSVGGQSAANIGVATTTITMGTSFGNWLGGIGPGQPLVSRQQPLVIYQDSSTTPATYNTLGSNFNTLVLGFSSSGPNTLNFAWTTGNLPIYNQYLIMNPPTLASGDPSQPYTLGTLGEEGNPSQTPITGPDGESVTLLPGQSCILFMGNAGAYVIGATSAPTISYEEYAASSTPTINSYDNYSTYVIGYEGGAAEDNLVNVSNSLYSPIGQILFQNPLTLQTGDVSFPWQFLNVNDSQLNPVTVNPGETWLVDVASLVGYKVSAVSPAPTAVADITALAALDTTNYPVGVVVEVLASPTPGIIPTSFRLGGALAANGVTIINSSGGSGLKWIADNYSGVYIGDVTGAITASRTIKFNVSNGIKTLFFSNYTDTAATSDNIYFQLPTWLAASQDGGRTPFYVVSNGIGFVPSSCTVDTSGLITINDYDGASNPPSAGQFTSGQTVGFSDTYVTYV